ncbi:hypothetical protein GH714_011910 [Hevea brasiliensis]|uniref:Myb/SANT-like domain-containing protein n=1 Tax=Hevea brasiliensis TaxID=3981 RepID=A0A6A6K443_HEVBR|nr:hypothetical protein GH714_011910 [Hevea brasiliensis]
MSGRDHVVWTNEMDNVLINGMLEEDHKGNRPEGTWNTRAFDNMLQEKLEARKWMHTPINNYDKLYERYGDQRATSEYAESAREKVRRCEFNWANEVNDNNMNSPEPSLHSQGTFSRGSKRKASMMEMLERQYESKQCTSFKTRAIQVKNGLENAVPGINVLLNPDKPRRGCFEIWEEGGEKFISVLDMNRPFKPMKDLDMEKVISDIIDKIK